MSHAQSSRLNRRNVLRGGAAAGLVAVSATGVTGCVSPSTGIEPQPQPQPTGEVSADNPLGAARTAELEVVVVNGGLGTQYATDVHIPSYEATFSKVRFTSTQEVSVLLQPRFAGGNPPDVVHNAGLSPLDLSRLVGAGQLADLSDLFAAPSLDMPGMTVGQTLRLGTIEQGGYDGTPFVLNYAYTVHGLWFSGKLFRDNGWAVPKTWPQFTALLDRMKAEGIVGYSYAGADAAHHQVLVILTTAAKIGGPDVLKDLDNLVPDAWKHPAIRQAATLWSQIGVKYADHTHLGLKHSQVQLLHNQYQVGFYPSGTWLEHEQAEHTPPGFDYQLSSIPSATSSDVLPAGALYAAAAEQFFVPSKGSNMRGGKEYLRHMLSRVGARSFTELTKSLTVVRGAEEGLTLSPGRASAAALLAAAPATFGYRFDTWYPELDQAGREAVNELMFQAGGTDRFVRRMQRAADEVKADGSIPKFHR